MGISTSVEDFSPTLHNFDKPVLSVVLVHHFLLLWCINLKQHCVQIFPDENLSCEKCLLKVLSCQFVSVWPFFSDLCYQQDIFTQINLFSLVVSFFYCNNLFKRSENKMLMSILLTKMPIPKYSRTIGRDPFCWFLWILTAWTFYWFFAVFKTAMNCFFLPCCK